MIMEIYTYAASMAGAGPMTLGEKHGARARDKFRLFARRRLARRAGQSRSQKAGDQTLMVALTKLILSSLIMEEQR